jgi:hypothetical protein
MGENIKVNLKNMGWEGVDWIHLAQDRDRCRALVEHSNELLGSIKGG